MSPGRRLRAVALAATVSLPVSLGARAASEPASAAPAPSGAPSAAATPAPPAERPWFERIDLSGLAFGDAYVVLEHHDPEIRSENGFWLRRIYLTADIEVAEGWSARLRMEANSPGDFQTKSKLEPFVKDAYLAWKGTDVALFMGISPSPTFELIEAFWGYRAVEKTPLDLYRMGSSRDFGLAAKGTLAAGKLLFHLMLGNGAGESSETNEGKKAMLAVGFRPSNRFVVELYADTENRPESADRTTWQGFVGLRGERSRFGLQYAHQERQVAGGDDEPLAVASAFGAVELSARATVLLRYDRTFDANPEAGQIPYFRIAEDTAFDMALLGLDWALADQISLIPNLEWLTYRERDGHPAPDDDLIAKLTLSFRF